MNVAPETPARNETGGDEPAEPPPSGDVAVTIPIEGAASSSGGTTPAPVSSGVSVATPTSTFEIQIRSLKESDAQSRKIAGSGPADAFDVALAADVSNVEEPLMKWADAEQAVALDFDRPDGAAPLTEPDIDSVMTPNAPNPRYAWITHGGGLRLIFFMVGEVTALAIAGVWLMLARLGQLAAWRLEVKTDTRHPKGLRDGLPCGRIVEFEPTADFSLRGDEGAVSDADINAWLGAYGLTMGRHGSEQCPWSCGPSSGNPPVSVTDRGVRCFRCGRFAPWWELVGAVDGMQRTVYRAARSLVHIGHQQHVIRAIHPVVPYELVRPAWAHILRVVNADRLALPDSDERGVWERRVRQASSPALDIARSSSGGWLDSTTLAPRKKVSADKTLKFLPSCFWPPMVDKAEDTGPLDGFVPLQPIGATEVLAPGVLPPRGTLLARRPVVEGDPPPIDVTSRPTLDELETAWQVLDAALPGICRGYHFGILVAMLVGQRAVGTPPIICATGQSGSAKTGQVHLAAGALGSKAAQIVLGSTDDTTRKAGLALEEGAGAIFADEVGRVDSVFTKLEPILSANSELAFRPKYSNERRVPMRCAVFLLGSTQPQAIVKSPELARRGVGYRLTGADKKWALVDPKTERKLDLSEARRIDAIRGALDTITAAAWWVVHDLGPGGDWRRLLIDTYGAVDLPDLDLVDSDGSARHEAILALYDAYRTAKAGELSTMHGWKGWLIADPGTSAGSHLNALVEIDAEKPRFTAETSDLERLNLAPVLGFATPQLQLIVRRRSPHTLVKFVEVGVMRGKGTPRTELPAAILPNASPVVPPNGAGAAQPADHVTVTL